MTYTVGDGELRESCLFSANPSRPQFILLLFSIWSRVCFVCFVTGFTIVCYEAIHFRQENTRRWEQNLKDAMNRTLFSRTSTVDSRTAWRGQYSSLSVSNKSFLFSLSLFTLKICHMNKIATMFPRQPVNRRSNVWGGVKTTSKTRKTGSPIRIRLTSRLLTRMKKRMMKRSKWHHHEESSVAAKLSVSLSFFSFFFFSHDIMTPLFSTFSNNNPNVWLPTKAGAGSHDVITFPCVLLYTAKVWLPVKVMFGFVKDLPGLCPLKKKTY